VKYNEFPSFNKLLIDDNSIHFEVIDFKLSEMLGNILVKAHFYNLKNEYVT